MKTLVLYSLIAEIWVTKFLDCRLEQMLYKGFVDDIASENQSWTGALCGCLVKIRFPACCEDDVPACGRQRDC